MAQCFRLRSLVILALGSGHAAAARAGDELHLTTVIAGSGFDRPVFAAAPAGDAARLFVLEHWTGQIRILQDHAILPTPFLDLGSLITVGDDQGARCFAFHPQFAKNGELFVTYVDLQGDLVLARYRVSNDPNVADPLSAEVLLTIAQPGVNHCGGMIAFSPRDGYLYVGTGDGGPGNDPSNRAQDPSSLLGKILRLDVDTQLPYAIPPDNPFVGQGDPRDEIWALGLRHPWRFSFDRLTSDLWLGDVGQYAREEIDFQPGTSTGGENYGWRCSEGFRCTALTGCTCGSRELTAPIWDYGRGDGCSVIGGYVYRGCAIPELQGTYFFADYCSARISSLRQEQQVVVEARDWTGELAPPSGTPIGAPFSFAEDALGELYILDGVMGNLWKIVARDTFSRWTNYGAGWPGARGVPTLVSRDQPALCQTISIVIGNSSGAPTRAHLLIGLASSSSRSAWDGTYLVQPSLVRTLVLPESEAVTLITIPCEVALCQTAGYLQVVEEDPGASKGMSFSAGLQLRIGDR